MSNDMLGSLMRALVGVPASQYGVILDVVNKLGGKHPDIVRTRLASLLRENPDMGPTNTDAKVCVDRSVRISYPGDKKLHPEIENIGPAEYQLSSLEHFLHYTQEIGDQHMRKGPEIYAYLQQKNLLKHCLSLQDGSVLERKGIWDFRRFFKGRSVALWKSTYQSDHPQGGLFVPVLHIVGELAGGKGTLCIQNESIDNYFDPPLIFNTSVCYLPVPK